VHGGEIYKSCYNKALCIFIECNNREDFIILLSATGETVCRGKVSYYNPT